MSTGDKTEVRCNIEGVCSYKLMCNGYWGCNYQFYCDYQLPRDSRRSANYYVEEK